MSFVRDVKPLTLYLISKTVYKTVIYDLLSIETGSNIKRKTPGWHSSFFQNIGFTSDIMNVITFFFPPSSLDLRFDNPLPIQLVLCKCFN